MAQVEFKGLNEYFAVLEKKRGLKAEIPRIVDKALDVSEEYIKGYRYKGGYSTGATGKQLVRKTSDGGRDVEMHSEAKNSRGRGYQNFVEFGHHSPKQPVFQEAQKKGKKELMNLAKELINK